MLNSTEANVVLFVESAIRLCRRKLARTKEINVVMKHYAHTIRTILWHYNVVLNEDGNNFDIWGISINKKKEVYLLATDRRVLELKIPDLDKLMMLHPKLKLPFTVSWVDIIGIENTLRVASKTK